MPVEGGSAAEFLGTVGAGEDGLLAGVDTAVLGEGRLVDEPLAAVRTGVSLLRFLTGVGATVFGEIKPTGEALATVSAGEGLLARVFT